jgi:hypothetical protein
MTLRTPPSWLQNGSHPAENDRLTTQALWATTGIINSSSLAVTQNSPVGMSVIIAGGWAAIVGTTQSNMGTYVGYNDAPTVVAITTANPTNPRIDLICMTVQDAYYTGASNNVIFQVVAGTPAGSPVVPSVPANSIALAEVAVAAGALSITTGNITDRRVLVTTNIPETGDITAVTAGTGLSGGGTTGAVTLAINTAVTADLTTAQTLTNKTLTAPTVTNGTFTTPTLTSPLINIGVNAKTAAYTTIASDDGKIIPVTSSSTANITLAASLYNTGAQINVARMGTGAVSIVGDTGVTVVSTGVTVSAPTLRAQYSTATAIMLSSNSWLVVGDIA